MTTKTYQYVNDIGYNKLLVVRERKDNNYDTQIWSQDTGDFCGSAICSQQELNDFLMHYHITPMDE